MDALWAGRFSKGVAEAANDYNASIRFDARMIREDIMGSMAHADMLAACGINRESDNEAIQKGLQSILADVESGVLPIDPHAEDVHSFVEFELVKRIGDAGKRLHTGRSRNDQVAVDLRLYLRKEVDAIIDSLKRLAMAMTDKAEQYADAIMPGYTHMQRAQPITFGHHMMAYAFMILRDIDRLRDARKRMNVSPLGCAALAGTTYPIDRQMTARALAFDGVCANSLDGVSDRDYCVEIASALSLVMAHLSRLSEEIILWCSWEFRFAELDDAYATGSSIMPQKKNPDMAELTRGKTGRVYGNLMTLLTMIKGLPLAYNKDLQEDKEAIFDSVDTVTLALTVFIPMLRTMRMRPAVMREAAAKGFINATDCADYLVGKGMPFRAAYKAVGGLVADLIAKGKTLETATLEEYRAFAPSFDADVYEAIDLARCVEKRTSEGGTAPSSVRAQIAAVRAALA